MRRFSKKYQLVTLSDINITPLLDLAFVLLIIFVIATPLLEYTLDVELPEGGSQTKELKLDDLQLVEIDQQGDYFLNTKQVSLSVMEEALVQTRRTNENMVVVIRADQNGEVKYTYAVIDSCLKHNIFKFHLKTRPEPNP